MEPMHNPKDAARIGILLEMMSYAMQVGMMRTQQCCWEVRDLYGL